jgi:hypothetical protein
LQCGGGRRFFTVSHGISHEAFQITLLSYDLEEMPQQLINVRPQPMDYIYVMLPGRVAGIWQAWCLNYGSDRFLIPIVLTMSGPFVLLPGN